MKTVTISLAIKITSRHSSALSIDPVEARSGAGMATKSGVKQRFHTFRFLPEPACIERGSLPEKEERARFPLSNEPRMARLRAKMILLDDGEPIGSCLEDE